jgi:transcription elongation factor GreA
MTNDNISNASGATHPITVLGKKLLEDELKQLLSVDRPAVLQAIEVARGHGDLRENAEYHAAKERQAFMSGRIDYIKGVLASSTVIDPKAIKVSHIAFGATLTLIDQDKDEEVRYQIVGIDESDIAKRKISIASPLARALVGKKEGDEVVVKTPKGTTTYEVCSIEYL